jgi:small conductance mechanosensitive channel
VIDGGNRPAHPDLLVVGVRRSDQGNGHDERHGGKKAFHEVLRFDAGRIGRAAAAGALLAILAAFTLTTTSAAAQSFPGISISTPGPNAAAALDTLYASAPVVIDGVTLFRIVVPSTGNAQQSIAVRSNTVSLAIDQALAETEHDGGTRTIYDPATTQIQIAKLNGQIVLQLVDEHHRDGLTLVTVTTADADYRRVSVDVLAQQWQSILEGAIVHALDIRQPDIQERNANRVLRVVGGLIAITIGVFFLSAFLSRRITAAGEALAARNAELEAARSEKAATAPDTPAGESDQRTILGLLVLRIDPQKKLTLLRALRFIAIGLGVLAWFVAIAWGLLQFPQTAPSGHVFLHNGLSVAVIWIGALLLDRVLTIMVDRLPTLWELRAFGTAEDQQRQLLRAPTIARALAGFKSFVLFFVALLATMTQLGIPVGSVVTIGGVAAIAVSLAAQNLIRDVVSGFLVLIEDQFVVGDFVTINGNRGSVERLTLRMVQIRDATGSLVTVSHSAATQVINHSRNWSRVDYEISVDPASNVGFAISLLRQQIADLESDPEWKDAIVEPAEWIGIDNISRDGAVVRARIKTAPLRQFALRRELNARVMKAFSSAKIVFGAPVPPPGP